MSKVDNKYGIDTTVHFRKDGRISVRFDVLPSPEAYKAILASNMAAIFATALGSAMGNQSQTEANQGGNQTKIAG
jgi:hypothetical protein